MECLECEMKYFLAYWLARSVTAISDFLPPNVNEGSQNFSPADATPSMVIAEEFEDLGSGDWMQKATICYICHSLRWTRKQDFAPDSWGAYENHEFSEPRGLHFSIDRTLNSLTWYLIFPYLTIIFDVQTACSLCWKFVYSLIPPSTSLNQFSQLVRCYLPGFRSLPFPPNKITLLSGCD